MTGDELAQEETEHGNVAQDKITQEEVVNKKVKITLIPKEEEEEADEVVRRSAMWDQKTVCEAEHGELGGRRMNGTWTRR